MKKRVYLQNGGIISEINRLGYWDFNFLAVNNISDEENEEMLKMLENIHVSYFAAGSNLMSTNTYQMNLHCLRRNNISIEKGEEILDTYVNVCYNSLERYKQIIRYVKNSDYTDSYYFSPNGQLGKECDEEEKGNSENCEQKYKGSISDVYNCLSSFIKLGRDYKFLHKNDPINIQHFFEKEVELLPIPSFGKKGESIKRYTDQHILFASGGYSCAFRDFSEYSGVVNLDKRKDKTKKIGHLMRNIHWEPEWNKTDKHNKIQKNKRKLSKIRNKMQMMKNNNSPNYMHSDENTICDSDDDDDDDRDQKDGRNGKYNDNDHDNDHDNEHDNDNDSDNNIDNDSDNESDSENDSSSIESFGKGRKIHRTQRIDFQIDYDKIEKMKKTSYNKNYNIQLRLLKHEHFRNMHSRRFNKTTKYNIEMVPRSCDCLNFTDPTRCGSTGYGNNYNYNFRKKATNRYNCVNGVERKNSNGCRKGDGKDICFDTKLFNYGLEYYIDITDEEMIANCKFKIAYFSKNRDKLHFFLLETISNIRELLTFYNFLKYYCTSVHRNVIVCFYCNDSKHIGCSNYSLFDIVCILLYLDSYNQYIKGFGVNCININYVYDLLFPFSKYFCNYNNILLTSYSSTNPQAHSFMKMILSDLKKSRYVNDLDICTYPNKFLKRVTFDKNEKSVYFHNSLNKKNHVYNYMEKWRDIGVNCFGGCCLYNPFDTVLMNYRLNHM